MIPKTSSKILHSTASSLIIKSKVKKAIENLSPKSIKNFQLVLLLKLAEAVITLN